MATFEQENQQREALLAILTVLKEIKPDDLVRDELGRELNFMSGKPYFERNLKLFNDLLCTNLDNVPFSKLKLLTNTANQAKQLFDQVKSFSFVQFQSSAIQERDRIINQIRDTYDIWFDQISPIIAYSVRKGTDFDRLEREARDSAEVLRKMVVEQADSKKAMMNEINDTLEKIKRAAQEVGVAQHAVHFQEEAEEQKRLSFSWLVVTGIFGLVTLFVGVASAVYFSSIASTLTTAQSLQLAVAKLFVFSVLLTATIWTGKIYRALRHNYVINKHRQNALSTFETFVKASNDEQTKSAVLLQATQCIFSSQHTGYITHEADGPASPQILEIIRGFSGENKGK